MIKSSRGMHAVSSVLFAITVFALMAPVTAQQYPVRPIRMIVTSAPAGGSDFVGRLAAQRLTEALGQQVIVENRPGIAAQAGNEFGVRTTMPDGYTLTLVTPSYTINPSVRPSGFDPLKEYTPVFLIGKAPTVLMINPSLGTKDVRELIALAKSRKEQLAYGSSGQGTIIHLTTELFLLMANVKMLHVPYKGGGPALVDLLSGQIQVVFATPQTGMQQVRAGKLRALGVTSSARISAEPDIPTIAESGVPGYEATNWHAIIAPKGTPAAIVNRLNETMRRILVNSEFLKILHANGIEAAGGSPAELHEHLRQDFAKWAKVIKAANVTAE
jgi:tripartite-type tricarboxylate transporter receptor subunit TctC